MDEREALNYYWKAKRIIENEPDHPRLYSEKYNHVFIYRHFAIRFPKRGRIGLYPGVFRDRYGAQSAFAQHIQVQNPPFRIPKVYYYSQRKPQFAILEAFQIQVTICAKAKKSVEHAEELAKLSKLDIKLVDFYNKKLREYLANDEHTADKLSRYFISIIRLWKTC